jgi:hypothetical protein
MNLADFDVDGTKSNEVVKKNLKASMKDKSRESGLIGKKNEKSPSNDGKILEVSDKISESKSDRISTTKPDGKSIKKEKKSLVKKTQRGSSENRKEEDDDMADANIIPPQNTSSPKMQPVRSAINFSLSSPEIDDQSGVHQTKTIDSDEKSNYENKSHLKENSNKWKFVSTSCDELIPLRPKTFEELRNSEGYIDKTKLILDFHYKFQESTCILRQRRSGKTRAIQMLKSFYCVPRIDVDTYDPETTPDPPSTKMFEGTFLDDSSQWDEPDKKDPNFIENNMGKYPVISLVFKDISFTDNSSIKKEEVIDVMIEEIIKPAFQEYDYLFFISLAKKICFKKYGDYTTENYKNLFSEHNLKKYKKLQDKIDCLLAKFPDELTEEILIFYKYYKGQIGTMKEVISALKFLMKTLNEHYERKVIVLVDEHDTPVTSIHSEMSLENPEEDKAFEKSIEVFSNVVCDIFKAIAKENPHLEKFLMFGISRGILDLDNSSFNVLIGYDVLEERYSEYFGFYEEEVSKVVDSSFRDISDKHKGIIKANAKEWYNGYYFGKNKSLHSTYSTT